MCEIYQNPNVSYVAMDLRGTNYSCRESYSEALTTLKHTPEYQGVLSMEILTWLSLCLSFLLNLAFSWGIETTKSVKTAWAYRVSGAFFTVLGRASLLTMFIRCTRFVDMQRAAKDDLPPEFSEEMDSQFKLYWILGFTFETLYTAVEILIYRAHLCDTKV